MAALKTLRNNASVEDFLNSVENELKRKDAFTLLALFEKVTGYPAEMWGDAIVCFGSYHYKYASGQEGDWMLTAFSPRKQNISIYIMTGLTRFENLLSQLGKHKKSKGSCLYINKLSDIDVDVLAQIIKESVAIMKEKQHG